VSDLDLSGLNFRNIDLWYAKTTPEQMRKDGADLTGARGVNVLRRSNS